MSSNVLGVNCGVKTMLTQIFELLVNLVIRITYEVLYTAFMVAKIFVLCFIKLLKFGISKIPPLPHSDRYPKNTLKMTDVPPKSDRYVEASVIRYYSNLAKIMYDDN